MIGKNAVSHIIRYFNVLYVEPPYFATPITIDTNKMLSINNMLRTTINIFAIIFMR